MGARAVLGSRAHPCRPGARGRRGAPGLLGAAPCPCRPGEQETRAGAPPASWGTVPCSFCPDALEARALAGGGGLRRWSVAR